MRGEPGWDAGLYVSEGIHSAAGVLAGGEKPENGRRRGCISPKDAVGSGGGVGECAEFAWKAAREGSARMGPELIGRGAEAIVAVEADPDASLTSSETAAASMAEAAGSSSGNTVAVGGGDRGGSDGTRRLCIREGLVMSAAAPSVTGDVYSHPACSL